MRSPIDPRRAFCHWGRRVRHFVRIRGRFGLNDVRVVHCPSLSDGIRVAHRFPNAGQQGLMGRMLSLKTFTIGQCIRTAWCFVW